jgi:hypothetical protein
MSVASKNISINLFENKVKFRCSVMILGLKLQTMNRYGFKSTSSYFEFDRLRDNSEFFAILKSNPSVMNKINLLVDDEFNLK